jgi:peptidoglycan/xylan/chitin deacetylase (PgdA/CDA1 family)
MNRRQFAKNIGMGVAALGMRKATFLSSTNKQPEIAITLDDFNVYDTPTLSGAARNQAILDALVKYNLQAGMFVNGKYVDNETDRT